ncbi:hypothetical protein LEN26_000034 [Aphanomyces euteiches]|nr:hypothetical protein AeMF1_015830 [Aphanomyces euteiches]KAH9164457.1 hypothetical protein LEN26_000034 [Aphanomyces euteiches]KAH9195106.1 hypothetical protein AeNC1_002921 [Aphanomyces euteiches]
MADKCFFNGCDNECAPGMWKCDFHKNRVRCRGQDCRNQVYARYLCVRHGGKKKCQYPNCTGNSRVGMFCCRHGASSKKKLCIMDGCTKVAHARRLCVGHGGGRLCKVNDCTAHARHGGFCRKHGRENEPTIKTECDGQVKVEMVQPMPIFLEPKALIFDECTTFGELSPIDVFDFDIGQDMTDLDILLDIADLDCPWYTCTA